MDLNQSQLDAMAAVAAAVARGVLLARDTQSKARWVRAIMNDPSCIELLNAAQGNPAITVARITSRHAKT
jgi:hypothetical protein